MFNFNKKKEGFGSNTEEQGCCGSEANKDNCCGEITKGCCSNETEASSKKSTGCCSK